MVRLGGLLVHLDFRAFLPNVIHWLTFFILLMQIQTVIVLLLKDQTETDYLGLEWSRIRRDDCLVPS